MSSYPNRLGHFPGHMVFFQQEDLGLLLFQKKMLKIDPFVVHEHDDWVFTLLRDMCLPPNLVTTSAHYLSDVKKKKKC